MPAWFLKILGVWAVSGLVFASEARAAEVAPPGERPARETISLALKDSDLLDVLKMLSNRQGLNLVMSKEVSGTVSVNLHDVTVEEALAAILEISDFAIEQKGDILFVRPRSKVVGAPYPQTLEQRTYRLNYVAVADMSGVVKSYLSPAGRVTIHAPSDTLFVEDVPSTFPRIEPLIAALDRVPQQVLIEAKILEVRLGDHLQFGVDWKKVFSQGRATGSIEATGLSGLPGAGSQGLFFTVATPNFEAFMDALATQEHLKALAAPRLVALNNKPATIVIGGRLGFRTTTTVNQVTTESVDFLDVGTQLRLTPHIDHDGHIMMDIHPEVSDGVVTAGLPSKTTTEVTTSVVAKDGETIFIGGLIRDRTEDVKRQVPILGKLPILGYLFSRTETTNTKTEIIVLITPHLGPVDLASRLIPLE